MSGASTVTEGNVDVRHQFALGNGLASPETSLVAQISVGNSASLSSNLTSGPVAGLIIVESGGSIGVAAPGAPVIGNLQLSQLKLLPGANIDFKIWNAGQAAGTGYDKLDLGTLDLTGVTSENRVMIRLISMSSANGFGAAFDFPLEANRSFQFGTYNPGTLGNINDLFAFDVSSFYHSGSPGVASDAGLWSINFDNANGLITLTAVPEPSTYGFGLGALALAAAAIRRRKKRLEPKA
jgi:hypothetical protein